MQALQHEFLGHCIGGNVVHLNQGNEPINYSFPVNPILISQNVCGFSQYNIGNLKIVNSMYNSSCFHRSFWRLACQIANNYARVQESTQFF